MRNPGEIALGSIPGALEIPLAQMQDRLDEIDLDRPIVVHCAGGYRSSLGASWLRSQGATDVSDLLGGYDRVLDVMAFPIIVTFSAAVTFGDIRYRAPAEIPILLLAAVFVDARWRAGPDRGRAERSVPDAAGGRSGDAPL